MRGCAPDALHEPAGLCCCASPPVAPIPLSIRCTGTAGAPPRQACFPPFPSPGLVRRQRATDSVRGGGRRRLGDHMRPAVAAPTGAALRMSAVLVVVLGVVAAASLPVVMAALPVGVRQETCPALQVPETCEALL